jgi:hypothetical protein
MGCTLTSTGVPQTAFLRPRFCTTRAAKEFSIGSLDMMSRQETSAESCVQRAFLLGAAPLPHHLRRSRACYTYMCVCIYIYIYIYILCRRLLYDTDGTTAVQSQPPPRAKEAAECVPECRVCVKTRHTHTTTTVRLDVMY